jgi:hypothetical protein
MLRQHLTFRCVSYVLAALLAVAAALKLHLLLNALFTDIKPGTSRSLLGIAVSGRAEQSESIAQSLPMNSLHQITQ